MASALIVVVVVAVVVLLPGDVRAAFSPVQSLTLALLLLATLAVLQMLARPRVEADEGGVTVVNLIVRRRLDWAEIVEVSLQRGDPWVSLHLVDGETLPAMGLQSADGEWGRRQAAQFRALVLRRRAIDRDDGGTSP
jgi:Bacterial PH domain